MRIVDLDENTRSHILSDLLKRDPNNYDAYGKTVQEIVDDVKERRDEALFTYTKKFDGADITAENVRVTEEEIEEAKALVDPGLMKVMERAKRRRRRQEKMR